MSIDNTLNTTPPARIRTAHQKHELLAQIEQTLQNKSIRLKLHVKRNQNTEHINYKIYHLLLDPHTFINAQVSMHPNKGFLTKGVDPTEDTNMYFGVDKAIQIATKFKKKTYKFKPVRRVYISKKQKSKFRPIDTPTQEDRIVQEALRGILEAIYEPEFTAWEKMTNYRATNYGFRPNKGTFDAVSSLKNRAQGTSFAIEGDFSDAYNSISHKILLQLLSKRIHDKQILKLLKQLLEAGVMHQESFTNTLTGTPQGGILSPLLFNIYMFEFDKWIFHTFIKPLEEKPPRPVLDPDLCRIRKQMSTIRRSLKSTKENIKRRELTKTLKSLQRKTLLHTSYTLSSISRKANYVRYADDWILCVTGTKAEAQHIKLIIKEFTEQTLSMTLNNEKTLVTKMTKGFSFLGYTVKMNTPQQMKVMKLNTTKNVGSNTQYVRPLHRTTSRKIRIGIDIPRICNCLVSTKLARYKNNTLFPQGNAMFAQLHPFEIVQTYREKYFGLFQYYRHVDSPSTLNYIGHLYHYSCAMSIARRERSSLSKTFQKYGKSLKITSPDSKHQTEFLTYPQLTKKYPLKEGFLIFKTTRSN